MKRLFICSLAELLTVSNDGEQRILNANSLVSSAVSTERLMTVSKQPSTFIYCSRDACHKNSQ